MKMGKRPQFLRGHIKLYVYVHIHYNSIPLKLNCFCVTDMKVCNLKFRIMSSKNCLEYRLL